ncbi:MAG: GIY-YIG nuclease family protein [Nitrospirae bacterium]|nr:GIY-YIG nuclease family protein [Nitrospirota bacterium]
MWAVQELAASPGKLRVYTDSQCVSRLLERKQGLVSGNFLSGRTKRPLHNASLYREYYEFHDALGFEVVWVKGHVRAHTCDAVGRIFSFVDKKAGQALRTWMDEFEKAEPVSAHLAQNDQWCVYILRCRNNSLYTGMTNNIERRLKAHEQGRGSKYVRSWRPFELVKTIPCRNAGEARKLEYELKRLSRSEKIDTLNLSPGLMT